jgi:hypothetical protein
MKEFVAQGGRLIWSGPPPLLTLEGEPARETWQDLFGVDYQPRAGDGVAAPGKLVTFEGPLAQVQPQIILTDFLVDRVYPVTPRPGTGIVARMKEQVVGTQHGSATFLGFRPRDDQSRSLGYDPRTWFGVLAALGAYPPTGKFSGVEDNTDFLSRTGPYLATRFPNGAVALAPHLREIDEGWQGGFARDQIEDRKYMEQNPPPSESVRLQEFHVSGHTVSFTGENALAFRADDQGNLIAFAGRKCHEITVDGHKTAFADAEMDEIGWAPVALERRIEGGALLQLQVSGEGTVRIPAAGLPTELRLFVEGPKPGSRGALIPSQREGDSLVFKATKELRGRWIYGGQ